MKTVTIESDDDSCNDEAHLIPKDDSRNNNSMMILCSLVMMLGALAGGTMLGLSSPLIPGMQNDTKSEIKVCKNEASWIGSLLSLGGIVGGLTAGLVMQAAGRKFTSIISGVPYVGGLLLIAYATNVYMVYAGRFITGIGLAFTSLVVPTYIGEIATQSYRGLLGSGNQLAITLGIFLIYGVGGFLTWRWLAIAAAFIPVLYVILCLFIPESPRHLYIKNERRQSIATLQWLRGKKADISSEVRELDECACISCDEATWKEIFTVPSIRHPFLLSMATMFFQQISGINCIMFYAQNIFKEAGFKTASQYRAALLLVSGIQVVFTFISCILVDRTGRKILWTISSTSMGISMVTFGLYFQLQSSCSGITWLALVSMMVYISSFSIGLGPLPWLLMVELIPLRAKGKCSGAVTMLNLLFCFVITKEFNDLQNLITPQGTFWLFAGVCFFSLFFGICFLPETRGKTLEEIQAQFESRSVRAGYEEIKDDNPDA